MSELHDKALLTLRDKASMYCNHPTASKPAKAIIRDLLAENERLAKWIEEDGKRTNTCTRNVLRKICDDCQCGAKEKRP